MTEGITDIHTHSRLPRPDAVLSIDVATEESLPEENRPLSVGIHPWSTPAPDNAYERLETWARSPKVVAIGETGLDKRRGASLETQTEILERHILLSERLAKPLVLHIVGCYNEIIRLHRLHHPTQPWIIHGFRGKPQLARQLVDDGFILSFGEHFNPESLSIVPPERRLFETDESSLPIEEIIARATVK